VPYPETDVDDAQARARENLDIIRTLWRQRTLARRLWPASVHDHAGGTMSDADELAAEAADGRALALHHPVHGLLPMAHVFATDDGLAFADHGWDQLLAAGTHPFHAVAGRVRRSGAGWVVETVEGEEALIVPLDDAKLRRLQIEDWSPGDRDLCLQQIRQSVAPSAREVTPTWVGLVAGARSEADLGLGQEQAG
jgi:hypothetical protein